MARVAQQHTRPASRQQTRRAHSDMHPLRADDAAPPGADGPSRRSMLRRLLTHPRHAYRSHRPFRRPRRAPPARLPQGLGPRCPPADERPHHHLLGAPATRVVGTLWLLAAAVLLIAAALHIAARESWWIAGAVGLLLSQALLILAWPDAKFGTVANLFILIAVISASATARFDRKVADERATLLADVVTMPGALVDAEALVDLPAPVRRWLSRAGVVGRPRSWRVRLAQSGELRTTPDARARRSCAPASVAARPGSAARRRPAPRTRRR